VTTAKILAMALGKPLYGLDTLRAYAKPVFGSEETVVATRSRRNEVYAQFFTQWEEPGPPVTLSDADLAARCLAADREYPLHVAGPGEVIRELAGAHTEMAWPPAEGLAAVLAARIAAGAPDDPRVLTPVYVASPIITTPKDSRGIPG
jgi:tRNA A37 threonylcarbamoyladenosine modification protein TsaB